MSVDESGVRGALKLDDAARALALQNAAANPEVDQLGLFEGSSVFGTLTMGTTKVIPNGKGRPKGSPNRTTADLVKLIQATGRHPLLAMAEIVATPIDVIAQTLGCKKLEAAEYHRKVMSDLAPYVAQRQPQALQIEGANAGMLQLIVGMAATGGEVGGFGLDLTLSAQSEPVTIENEQNQGLSNADSAASNDQSSNE
jgi:hypothetical protein